MLKMYPNVNKEQVTDVLKNNLNFKSNIDAQDLTKIEKTIKEINMKNEQDKIQKHNQSVSKLIKIEEQASFLNQIPTIILSNPTFLESKYQSAHNLPSIKKSTLIPGNNHIMSIHKLETVADRK